MPACMCSTRARPNRQPTHKCVHPRVHLPVSTCPMSARVLTTMYHLNRAKLVQASSSCSPNNSWAWPCKVSPFCPYICCEGSIHYLLGGSCTRNPPGKLSPEPGLKPVPGTSAPAPPLHGSWHHAHPTSLCPRWMTPPAPGLTPGSFAPSGWLPDSQLLSHALFCVLNVPSFLSPYPGCPTYRVRP